MVGMDSTETSGEIEYQLGGQAGAGGTDLEHGITAEQHAGVHMYGYAVIDGDLTVVAAGGRSYSGPDGAAACGGPVA